MSKLKDGTYICDRCGKAVRSFSDVIVRSYTQFKDEDICKKCLEKLEKKKEREIKQIEAKK